MASALSKHLRDNYEILTVVVLLNLLGLPSLPLLSLPWRRCASLPLLCLAALPSRCSSPYCRCCVRRVCCCAMLHFPTMPPLSPWPCAAAPASAMASPVVASLLTRWALIKQFSDDDCDISESDFRRLKEKWYPTPPAEFQFRSACPSFCHPSPRIFVPTPRLFLFLVDPLIASSIQLAIICFSSRPVVGLASPLVLFLCSLTDAWADWRCRWEHS